MKLTVLAFSISAFTLACGSPATEVSKTISADTGGSISLDDSVLQIPAAALAVDTEVTMRLDSMGGFAALEDAHHEVITIEPVATTLAVAGTLTLDLGGPVESGERVVAYRLVDGAWSALETEVVSGGLVQTAVTSLGSYAVTRRAATTGGGNRIAGVLRWGTGDPVADAPVELHQNGARLTEILTDAQGGFGFVDLSPGEYQIVVSFECDLAETVSVSADEPTEVDLVLCQF